MKKIFLCLALLLSINTALVVAQSFDSLAQLRNQISELEKIELDENTPLELKKMNAGFLEARRTNLRKILEARIESAKQYLVKVRTALSDGEVQTIEQNILAWQRELDLDRAGVPPARATSTFRESESVSQPVSMRTETPSFIPPSAPAAPPVPQSQNRPIQSTPLLLPAPAAALIRLPVAEINNPSDARALIERAFNTGAFRDSAGTPIPLPSNIDDKNFHCVIHVLRWSDPSNQAGTDGNQTVAAQNWYVYNNGKAKGLRSDRVWSQEDFSTADRIYGTKRVWLLYVHINKWDSVSYKAYYDFRFFKKTPTNVSNLLALAQVFAGFVGAAPAAPPGPENVWGGSFTETDYVPSDAIVTASIIHNPGAGPYVALDKPKKFDNEGLYWWDFSVGVPIRKIKELQFDSTNNTITAKEVDQQNAFALLNLYFPPKDLKGSNFSWIPHFVGGVAIAKQPLKKFMFGAGFGPTFTNFYVGALFTEEKKPATLVEGSTATPDQLNNDLRRRFRTQFTFGINVPVRAVLSTLNKDK